MSVFELNDAAPKVLIADDDSYAVRSLAERCRRMGFEIETSASGRSALIKRGPRKPSISPHRLEGRWPQLLDVQAPSMHVVVMGGQSGQNAAESVDKLETLHILKGRKFFSKFDAVLAEAFSLRRSVDKKPAAETEITAIHRPQVLLVDDDMDIRKFIFTGLRKLGIQPSFAADGILGFWKAKKNPPTVIVSDYFMPNGDAEDLLARLRSTRETRNIPVIVQSGRQLSDEISQRLQGEIHGQPGASMILRKSLGAAELFGSLEKLCGLAKEPAQPASS
ncbi:MAG: response regulator [Hyphomicrobiaceae bacterium]|nr:response regulator [Hyphomicrobiaceae bacterium]